MKIEIERSGGLSGFVNTVSLDTEILPKEIAHRIERHLTNRISKNKPTMTMKKKNTTPDCYLYRISFQEGNEEHKIEFGEFDDAQLVSMANDMLRKKSKFR
jgi:hypothetical protein